MAESLFNLEGSQVYHRDSAADNLIIARVTRVIYGPFLPDGTTPDPDYTDITSIGCIKYVIYNSAQYYEAQGSANKIARPAYSFIHQYPAEGEYVLIIPGPSVEQNEAAGVPDYFYLPPFNLWRAPNHNAFPNLVEWMTQYNLQSTDYNDATLGNTAGPSIQSASTFLGEAFPELPDIKSIRPFPGDIFFEGRWGQSIRFGSSNTVNRGINPWADSNNNGDPITIIRNGQGRQSSKDGFELTVENIDVDNSSIYLTAGQPLQVRDISANFPLTSWNTSLQTTTAAPIIVETTIPPLANTTLSAQEQDNNTLPEPTVEPEPTGSATTQQTTNTEAPPPAPPVAAPTTTPPPPAQDPRGLFAGEYTNNYNNVFELFSKKSGFNTIIYAYQKGT
jgi:hypothetical protein